MTMMRMAFGLLIIIHPLVPGAGVSLSVCGLDVGLIASAFSADVDNDDVYDRDLSR